MFLVQVQVSLFSVLQNNYLIRNNILGSNHNYQEVQMNIYDYLMINTEKNSPIYRAVEEKIRVGMSQERQVIEKVSSMVIKDRLVAQRSMEFSHNGKSLQLAYPSSEKVFIHPHALSQLCAKATIPMEYVNRMNRVDADSSEHCDWRLSVLSQLLNSHFSNMNFGDKRSSGPAKFLHRIVGERLLGFVSRRFNRHLQSEVLLHSFIRAVANNGAHVVEGYSSDVKFKVKAILPRVFMPIPNTPVVLGTEWSNSDFGAGRMQLALTVWFPNANRFSVLDTSMSKVHIGSVIDDSDLEVSDETAAKEADAQKSLIRDAVNDQLSEASQTRAVRMIQLAHEHKLPWSEVHTKLRKLLTKSELDSLSSMIEGEDVVDLPPIKKMGSDVEVSSWWVAGVVSHLSTTANDKERSKELEQVSGSFLSMFAKKVSQEATHAT